MGDAHRTTRVYHRRDDSDDDEQYKSTTVTRYKVNPRGDRYERTDKFVEVDDDRRSHYSGHGSHGHRHGHGERTSADFVEYERRERSYVPDRPRSAFDPEPADRTRTVYYERDVERREPDRDWDRRSRYDRHDDEVRVEKRVEERFDDSHGHEVERYRKETDYYREPEPASAPVIVRQRAPEQRIIVQEGPRQDLIVVRDREPEQRELLPYDEEYYYRHERREVGPYRGDRDRDRDHYHSRRDRRRRDDYHSDDEDYHYSRRVIRREHSESPHHHKRHLAEGALAGAGITALLSSRRDENGDIPENRGSKVLAGAALGALGTEALKRAHNAYEDYWNDGRESPDHHSTLKKGLGIAAVALAAAGAAKYYEASKIEKEEIRRGRSRTREYYSSGEEYSHSHSPSRSRPRSRRRSLSTFAKAALGTAATAGLVKHLRDKSKSKSRSRHGSSSRSKSRSKSRLRRGAELAGAAAAAGVAGKMWKDHRDKKKKERENSASRELSDDERRHYRHDTYSRSRSVSVSRSRSRSRARSLHSEAGADPELGLVEYGRDPLHPEPPSPSGRGYESEAEERRRNRRRRRDRSRSSSGSDPERKRSKSHLRDMAAAGAAAIGIKEYKDRKDRERERERRSRDRQSRDRDRDGRRYEDDRPPNGYFDDGHRPHSPPTASGGAYYPPYPTTPGTTPGGSGSGYPPFPEAPVPPPAREYQPYVPQDYTGYAPPPPPAGPPPPSGPSPPIASGAAGFAPLPAGPPPPSGPPGPPPAGGNIPPHHVSELSRSHTSHTGGKPEDAIRSHVTPPPIQIPTDDSSQMAKSVSFGPLSPTSLRTMDRHRREQIQVSEESDGTHSEDEFGAGAGGHHVDDFERSDVRRRRLSDTTHDRPMNRNGQTFDRGHHHHSSDSEDDIEDLPDRFDSQGRPLDERRRANRDGWTTRRGEFHRRRRRPGDWDVRGAWQVSGTEQERVERLVRHVTGALEGRRSWLGVLGEVLGGGLLEPGPDDESIDGRRGDRQRGIEDGYDARERRHGRRRRRSRDD